MAGPSVMVRFLGDASGLKKATDDTASQAGGSMAEFGKKAALAIGGAFAVDKVLDFAKASMNAAAQDAQSQAILAQTMKNSAGATDEQIKATEKAISSLSKHAAVADDDLRPALGNLVRATGDVTKSQDLLQIAVDASAGTGKDLQSVTLAMGKAAQGSTGGLAKLGVATKDASGNALTADQVFQNMAKTFKGDAATSADSAAGKMANAKIQFGEFQEQVGGFLIPVMGRLADIFTNVLLPAISGISDWISNNKEIVIAGFVGIGYAVTSAVLPAFIEWAVVAGTAAVETLLAAAPFIALGVVIAGVAYLIIHNFDTIKETAERVWNIVLGTIKTVWNWVHDNWPLLLAIITGPIGLAVLAITKHWDDIKAGAKAVKQWITDRFDDVVDFFTKLPGRISKSVSGMWDGIFDAFHSVINDVIGLWNKLHFTLPKIDWGPLHAGGQEIGVPYIHPLATGGIVTRPTLALIGEAGPEAVIPLNKGGMGPAVTIEHAYFSDEVDIDVFMARAAWAVRTRGV